MAYGSDIKTDRILTGCLMFELQMEENMTIYDYKRAKKAFEQYLDEYDRTDEKVKLKIVHTYGVVDAAKEIGRRLGLAKEDQELAEIIALLHDIGRFEQLKQFDSFEPGTMNHAAFGVELLFGKSRMIRRFVENDSYDKIIEEAIARHSDFKLEGITDERTLLHARLIRDADKLDNCRVKLEESLEVLLGEPALAVGKEAVSAKVWEYCLNRESVLSADRETKMDYWISYLAQYFDVNFRETFEIMKEENYIRRIADRIPYENQDTARKVETLVKMLEEYM